MARPRKGTEKSKNDDNYSKYGKKEKRNKQRYSTPFLICSLLVAFLIGFVSVPLGLDRRVADAVSKSEAFAESIIKEAKESGVAADANGTSKVDHGNLRFIIFHRLIEAQGAGNHLHGLLADEFDRVVCVSDKYKDFHLAFQSADPVAIQHCPDILARHNKEPPNTKKENTIELLNYHGGTPPNECSLKELLSSTKRVLHLTANTYPRWPHVPPHINFLKLYKPKAVLLDILPYPKNEPPPVVVHLRKADKEGGDSRKGVDEKSLEALGKLLPLDSSQHSPFLVTNNVPWFDYFEKRFGWSHPYWQIVLHSALGPQWEGRITEKPQAKSDAYDAHQILLQEKYGKLRKEIGTVAWESLQLWSDWYTLLRAQKVYHTFSDFSLSAVHWMKTWSRTYDGLDGNGKPILLQENWISDGESPRLVDRTGDALYNCEARTRGF